MTGWEIAAIIIFFVGVLGSLAFVIRRLLTRFWKFGEGMALLLQHLMWVGLGVNTSFVGSGDIGKAAGRRDVLFSSAGCVVADYSQERARLQARGHRQPAHRSDPLVRVINSWRELHNRRLDRRSLTPRTPAWSLRARSVSAPLQSQSRRHAG
jgi:hypothetical protein